VWSAGFLFMVDKWWQLVLISSIFCFNHFSIPSLYVLYSTEIAFPTDQASATGYLMAFSQTFGFLFGILFAGLLDGSRTMASYIFYITISCLFASVILSISIKEDLRKKKYEEDCLLAENNSDTFDAK
jgi:hypothetical protein